MTEETGSFVLFKDSNGVWGPLEQHFWCSQAECLCLVSRHPLSVIEEFLSAHCPSCSRKYTEEEAVASAGRCVDCFCCPRSRCEAVMTVEPFTQENEENSSNFSRMQCVGCSYRCTTQKVLDRGQQEGGIKDIKAAAPSEAFQCVLNRLQGRPSKGEGETEKGADFASSAVKGDKGVIKGWSMAQLDQQQADKENKKKNKLRQNKLSADGTPATTSTASAEALAAYHATTFSNDLADGHERLLQGKGVCQSIIFKELYLDTVDMCVLSLVSFSPLQSLDLVLSSIPFSTSYHISIILIKTLHYHYYHYFIYFIYKKEKMCIL